MCEPEEIDVEELDGLIINSRVEEVDLRILPAGLLLEGPDGDVGIAVQTENYWQNPVLKLKPGEDMRERRTRWIRMIMLHTTKVRKATVKPGFGKDTNVGERVNLFWSRNGKAGGAHITVDHDGTIYQHADLGEDCAFHGGSVNDHSIGIEIYLGTGSGDDTNTVYEGQLYVVAMLVNWLCYRFGIQRQMPRLEDRYEMPRIRAGGKDFVGVVGHRHQYNGKAPYDPCDAVMELLADNGFMEFDVAKYADKEHWKPIQKQYGLKVDGVPGPITCSALENDLTDEGIHLYPGGIWYPCEVPDEGGIDSGRGNRVPGGL
jgi:hypothetical protein